MLNLVRQNDCAQAREAASARLDCELSELETARLELHLRDCAECRAYAHEIETITAGLRAAPLERPKTTVLVPHRRRIPVHAAAAAAAVLVAVAGSSFALGKALNSYGPAAPPATTAQSGLNAALAQQHLLAMLGRTRSSSQRHPGGVQAI